MLSLIHILDGLPQGSYQASLDLGTAVASFSQKVDDRTAYTLFCKKCGATLYYTAVQAENVEKASPVSYTHLDVYKRQSLTILF